MARRNNNDGYIKGYNLKKMDGTPGTRFFTRVLNDDLKYLIRPEDSRPALGELGRLYDYFDENGYKIKGLELKNKHTEFSLDEIFSGLGITGVNGSDRIEEEKMSRVALRNGQGWMSTVIVADRRHNFPNNLFIIHSRNDIINLQKAMRSGKVDWVIMKRLVVENKETGREIVHMLKEVKKLENVHQQELLVAYLEKTNGVMAPVDNFSQEQLAFLWENGGENLYNHECKKEFVLPPQVMTLSCQGQS